MLQRTARVSCAGLLLRRSRPLLAPRRIPSHLPASLLQDPYGPALKGPSHVYAMDVCRAAPEPRHVWLSLLTDASPFVAKMLLVIPGHYTPDDCAALERSAVAAWSPNSGPGVTPRPVVASVTLLLGGVDSTKPASSTPGGPLAPGTYDVVVFADNALGSVIRQAPACLAAARRLAKPVTGVVGLWGSVSAVPVLLGSDPETVERNAAIADCMALLTAHGQTAEAQHGASSSSSGSEGTTASSAALGRQSARVLHQDLFLPFTTVKRRRFDSEYLLRLADVVALVRGTLEYRAYQHSARTRVDGARGTAEHQAETMLLPGTSAPVSFHAASFGGATGAADPVDVLARSLAESVGPERGAVRVALSHFVVTCDDRPVLLEQLGSGRGAVPGARRVLPAS